MTFDPFDMGAGEVAGARVKGHDEWLFKAPKPAPRSNGLRTTAHHSTSPTSWGEALVTHVLPTV